MTSAATTGKSIEEFVILSKMAKGEAAVELVKQVLESSSIFVFSELLQCDNIQELTKFPERKKYFDLLNLFAYGVYSEYEQNQNSLPPLTTGQRRKLQQLTIVSLAQTEKSIHYQSLLKECSIDNVRNLEDLIIEAIYAGLLQGKLDQVNQQLHVTSCMGRDVRGEDMEGLIKTLTDWCDRCQVLLCSLEDQMDQANQHRSEDEAQQKAAGQAIKMARDTVAASGSHGSVSWAPGTPPDVEDNYPPDVTSTSTAYDDRKKEKRSKLSGLRGSAPKIWKNN